MNRISKLALVFCYLLLFSTGVLYFPKWKQSGTEATISWDVFGYYSYLPALFIYKDIKQCGFQDDIIKKYGPTPSFQAAWKHASGNYVMKYSSGQAILLSPFFLIAHGIASVSTDYPADGFSYPYQLCIGIGALLFAFLGLFVLRKVLLNYFSDKETALTLVTLVFATNYLDYSAINGAMTHNTLFTLYALLLYLTIKFYKKPGVFKATGLGLLIGLMTLTRPTEIIAILIPALWNVFSFEEIKQRFQFWKKHYGLFFISTLTALAILSIQVIYWKLVTGQWLVYSYQNETFSWLRPHLINGLVSFRSGWLMYSPIMVTAFAGLFFLFKFYRNLFLPVTLFFVLFMYICFSWDVWWYGASLGQRAMVQSYPVLSIAIAAFWRKIFSSGWLIKIFMVAIFIFCAWYNLWLTHNCHRGGLFKAGEMTGPYLKAIFGKTSVDERVNNLLDNNMIYTNKIENPLLVFANDFESDTCHNRTEMPGFTGKTLFLNATDQFSSEYFFPLPHTDKKRIRASAEFMTPEKEWISWKMTQFILRFYNRGKLVQFNQVRVQRIMEPGQIKKIFVDAWLPEKPFNKVSVLCWNSGGEKTIFIDDIKVIIF